MTLILVSKSGEPYKAYGGLDSINQLIPDEITLIKKQYHTLKKRGKVFRVSMAGALYHHERLVHLTVALPPPATLQQLRNAIKRLFRDIKRENSSISQIEYRAAWVWQTGKKSGEFQPHVHILTNMPYTPQSWIYNRIQHYTGLQAHVWINLVDTSPEKRKRTVGYLSQYMVNQPEGSHVNYSQSDGWLPVGYEEQWNAIKAGLRAAYGDTIFDSPEWRKSAIDAIEVWILEQAGKKKQGVIA